ncbi:MAG TPA: sigma 54-interacting transcriptional regulator [Peptococcaceae bacterium]|nr:sigma 54-interacting transcriptional regulator [Peptococcaceae bacterium]
MINIIYAVPEDIEVVEKIAQSIGNKDVVFKAVGEIDMNVVNIMEEGWDSENTIIIARGITYLTIRKKFKHAHVLELTVTGYDIMRGIEECKNKYKAKKIAVILSESIVIEKEFIDRIMDVEVSVFPVRDHTHVVDVYNKVKNMDIDVILAGLTVSRLAEKDNLRCVVISNSYETNKIVIGEAFNIAKAIIEERKRNELIKIILENTNDGIIAVDNMGVITAYNEAFFNILNIPKKTVLKGKTISSISPKLEQIQYSLLDYQEANIVKRVNNKMVVINTKPIVIDNKTLGTVLFIQNIDVLQKTEIDIRQKLSKKGLVARYNFNSIIGNSEAIRKTIQVAKKYAEASSNVLIIGETGTGKELFAQSIHNSSKRSSQPFVAINCAALPEHLLESELFGYVEGAFTGAARGGKTGLFELAHRGTLFLDEISELPLGLQAKLLRVLQEKEIRRLGDDKIIPVDIRIISASNVDLMQKVKENKFRQDLLYRLDILRLTIPPLRQRKEDIKEIAQLFVSNFAEDKGDIRLTEDAIVELVKYDWPGNIRELKNICERLTVLCTNNEITGQDVRDIFEQNLIKNFEYSSSDKLTIDKAGKKKMTQQDIAKMLGISRTTLWRKTRQKNAIN